LHSLGIKHGDINKHSFLVHDRKATLIDFDGAKKPSNQEELIEELNQLGEDSREISGRGGRIVDGVVVS
jgi:predicted Ser/Thr protein kinase